VHCVIIGFGAFDVDKKVIYEYENIRGEPHAVAVSNINPYLVDAPDVVLTRRSMPICDAPEMRSGNKPIDDGNYLFTPDEEKAFLEVEPNAKPFFRRWLGGEEFLNNIERWYLWLGDCKPSELRSMPHVLSRVEAVRKFREASKSAPTRKLAATPTRFHTEFIPTRAFLALPQVSSERRMFIPVAFLTPEYLCGDKLRVIENATLFHFGVMTSTMHMAWVRYTTGRLKSDYQYSALIVYNNFPWPKLPSPGADAPPSPGGRGDVVKKIEEAAQAVLDARTQFPDASLADLYDPLTMPPVLVKAHQKLDAAVDAAYGKKNFKNDAERVAFLFELYSKLTVPLMPVEKKRRRAKTSALGKMGGEQA